MPIEKRVSALISFEKDSGLILYGGYRLAFRDGQSLAVYIERCSSKR
jgi:hypothetical protein